MWTDYYSRIPLKDTTLTPAQQKLVLGGEACLWAERIDETNLEPMAWPRGSAVAERLWSPANIDTTDVATRIDEQHCRLRRRGINASPIGPGYCRN